MLVLLFDPQMYVVKSLSPFIFQMSKLRFQLSNLHWVRPVVAELGSNPCLTDLHPHASVL